MAKDMFKIVVFAVVLTICALPFFVATPLLDSTALNALRHRQISIYVFGDSYTTTSWDPYDPQTQPNDYFLLGADPALVESTAGPGLTNWVGKLAYESLPGHITAFTYNYAAFAAMVTNDRYDFTSRSTDFRDETKAFLDLATRPTFKSSQGVAIIYFGTNDVRSHSFFIPRSHDAHVVTETMNDYWMQVEKIYDAGIRNIVIMLVQPVDRIPFVATWPDRTYAETIASNSVEWNKQLMNRVLTFRNNHPQVTIGTVNLFPIFNDILNDYVAYPNNTCMADDGMACLWTDNVHPGQVIHKAIAQGVATELGQMGFI